MLGCFTEHEILCDPKRSDKDFLYVISCPSSEPTERFLVMTETTDFYHGAA